MTRTSRSGINSCPGASRTLNGSIAGSTSRSIISSASFYQPMLKQVVEDLKSKGLAEESDGAICIFFRDPSGKTDDEGKPVMLMAPAIIQKADGAFTYATSDLACIRHRIETFHPDVIVYVVDDRQSLHFEQLFLTAQRTGLGDVKLVHVAFGKITGKDGKPFKTREGGTVGLGALLDEAVTRSLAKLEEIAKDRGDEGNCPRRSGKSRRDRRH
ncbi:MAG: arginine--tRNA ligase [Planctomycetota bacterium]